MPDRHYKGFDKVKTVTFNFGIALGKNFHSEEEIVQPGIEKVVEKILDDGYYDYLRDDSMIVMKKGAYHGLSREHMRSNKELNEWR